MYGKPHPSHLAPDYFSGLKEFYGDSLYSAGQGGMKDGEYSKVEETSFNDERGLSQDHGSNSIHSRAFEHRVEPYR